MENRPDLEDTLIDCRKKQKAVSLCFFSLKAIMILFDTLITLVSMEHPYRELCTVHFIFSGGVTSSFGGEGSIKAVATGTAGTAMTVPLSRL